jgi:hypothetical protein
MFRRDALVRFVLARRPMQAKRTKTLFAAVVLLGGVGACSSGRRAGLPAGAGAPSGTDAGDAGGDSTPPDVAVLVGPADFDTFELHYYSELGAGCEAGACDNATIIQRNDVATSLNGASLCSVLVPTSDTALVADLATRPEVLSTLRDPNLCRDGSGSTLEKMVVRLHDATIIVNTYSAGCPGAAFEQLRTDVRRLRQTYCGQRADGGV